MANEKRLIDANALRKVFINEECNCEMFPWAVDNAPTVDAVEVVRCKGCKKGHPELAPNGGVWCAKWNHVFSEDGFCSLGEKEINRK